jgi:esterase/lipase superfamily enzyme
MILKAKKLLVRLVIGAAGGALLMVLTGQVLGLFAASCTVVCKPDVAATMGAISGMFASLMVRGYEPG